MKKFSIFGFFGLLILFSILLVINSCMKETTNITNGELDLQMRSERIEIDKSLVMTGEKISSLIGEISFKKMILNAYNDSCIEEFLLYKLLEQDKYNSYNDLLSLSKLNPTLTIAFPSFAFRNSESFENHISNIDYFVILTENPEEVDSILAINKNNKLIKISSVFNENINYCVIKNSESFVAVNKSTKSDLQGISVPNELFEITPRDRFGSYLLYSMADIENAKFKQESRSNDLFVIQSELFKNCDEVENNDSKLDTRTGYCDEPCERDCLPKTKDELHRVKFSDKSAVKVFESGFHLPTVELIAYYAIANFKATNSSLVKVDLVSKQVFIKWNKMTGMWSAPLTNEITTWKKETMGDTWQVAWLERDFWGETKSNWNLGFAVGAEIDGVVVKADAKWSVETKYSDKPLGQSIIEYCDPALGEGSEYKPFSFNVDGGFWFREHVR